MTKQPTTLDDLKVYHADVGEMYKKEDVRAMLERIVDELEKEAWINLDDSRVLQLEGSINELRRIIGKGKA